MEGASSDAGPAGDALGDTPVSERTVLLALWLMLASSSACSLTEPDSDQKVTKADPGSRFASRSRGRETTASALRQSELNVDAMPAATVARPHVLLDRVAVVGGGGKRLAADDGWMLEETADAASSGDDENSPVARFLCPLPRRVTGDSEECGAPGPIAAASGRELTDVTGCLWMGERP